MKSRQIQFVLGLLLAAVTFLCYWPITGHKFVNYDDYLHLRDNFHIAEGLTWSSIVWAFSTGAFCNWHPLTWISFMANYEFGGLNPWGYHFVDLVLHTANSILLLVWLCQITKRFWPGAFVAALFAWHPLHVESVAWASERKDVLSTFFFLLTLLAYSRYTQRNSTLESSSKRFYVLALVCFALALMSKAMVVTVPFLMLLLDFWPLNRVSLPKPRSSRLELTSWVRTVLPVFAEKLPFFALSFGTSVITFMVQRTGGAVSSLESIPLSLRLLNVPLAYTQYFWKTIWPAKIAIIYPYTSHPDIAASAGAMLALLCISGLAVYAARRFPYFPVGWFWFIGTLVPVIGLVQVGSQAMADRYMYIPSIGLFMLLVWAAEDLFQRALPQCDSSAEVPQISPVLRWLPGSLAVISLAGCLVVTTLQIRYWRDGEILFRHAAEVIPDNYLAFDGLGKALDDQGRKDEALSCFARSVQIYAHNPQGRYNLGTVLVDMGRVDEAIGEFRSALKDNPNYVEAHHNLGSALLRMGDFVGATEHLGRAAALRPEDPRLHQDFGTVLLNQGKMDRAILEFTAALKANPKYAAAHGSLGVALIQSGKSNEACVHFREAVRLEPQDTGARFNLGLALLDMNQPSAAAAEFAAGIRLNPNDTRFHYRLAIALARQGNAKDAVSEYREALRLTPDFPEAKNELAGLLAANPKLGE